MSCHWGSAVIPASGCRLYTLTALHLVIYLAPAYVDQHIPDYRIVNKLWATPTPLVQMNTAVICTKVVIAL